MTADARGLCCSPARTIAIAFQRMMLPTAPLDLAIAGIFWFFAVEIVLT